MFLAYNFYSQAPIVYNWQDSKEGWVSATEPNNGCQLFAQPESMAMRAYNETPIMRSGNLQADLNIDASTYNQVEITMKNPTTSNQNPTPNAILFVYPPESNEPICKWFFPVDTGMTEYASYIIDLESPPEDNGVFEGTVARFGLRAPWGVANFDTIYWQKMIVSNTNFVIDSVEINFKLDMSQVTQNFNIPEVNGDFNNWCGNCDAMNDDNGDNIWEKTIKFFPGDTIEYKFSADNYYLIESLDSDDQCTNGYLNNNNRVMVVPYSDETLSVCWESCQPCVTVIPDQNFEQALINLGHDDVIDGQVLTANISGVEELVLYNQNITDLTGIEDFSALTYLYCNGNQLTSLDLSLNTALTFLVCQNNQLISLDVSGCNALNELYCYDNQLTSLDVSGCTALPELYCYDNQLTSLDVSGCTALTKLYCYDNQLTCLNLKNGNNLNFENLYTFDNPNLTCIEVDIADYSSTTWPFDAENFGFGDNHYFSNDCDYSSGCGGNNSEICDSTILIYDSIIFYDTVTNYQTIYDTVSVDLVDTAYVTIEDTVTTYQTIYDTITTYDTSYVSIGVTDTLYIDISITGTPNITNTISIYPNPANEFITINNGNYSTMTSYEIRIINSLGQVVFSNLISVAQFTIPVSSLGAEGTYFVGVLDENGNLVVTKYLIIN